MLTPLCQLAHKYGSDKHSAKHSYTRWYWDTFQARRELVRKVVEIGVGEGASLRMWRDFFPNAMIYGAELNAERIFQDERIEVIPCDQSNPVDLAQLVIRTGSDVDLFIDDGSHKPIEQADTCWELMPLLSPKVIYVIEDAPYPWLPMDDFSDYTWYEPRLERRRRHDNRLIVVRHK